MPWNFLYKQIGTVFLLHFIFFCMPIISLPCIIALVRICSTVLSKSGKNRHSSKQTVLLKWRHFRGKVFSSSPLSIMLAVVVLFSCFVFVDSSYQVRKLLSISNFTRFFFKNHEWVCDCVKCFFCIK